LSGVMRKAAELILFKGFSIGRDRVVISHLQYTDDILCIGEATVENLWTLKAILRGFEMTSDLKVNFWKSCLIVINFSLVFMNMVCTFLNCRIGLVSLRYIGLPIGVNRKSLSTWELMLERLRTV
ncbi:F-box protein, partial [Trifolium medium]|nr:F-box protein [Trifolium medium]